MIRITSILLFTIAAFVPTSPILAADKRASVLADAHTAIAGNFKDPNSAQFRNEYVIDMSGEFTVCGEVNAKNSYGAYVGFTPNYYTTFSGGKSLTDENISSFNMKYSVYCSDDVKTPKNTVQPKQSK